MNFAKLLALFAITVMVGLSGCDNKASGTGGSGGSSSAGGSGGTTETKNPDAKAWDPAAGTAAVKGVVKFIGTAPKRKVIEMGGEPKCGALHTDPVLDEYVIVNDNGTLRNVFVYVKSGLGAWKFSPPTATVTLDQKGCSYVPHIIGIQVGQTLKVLNSDPLGHNIHSTSSLNPEFNVGQAKQGDEYAVVFKNAEVMKSAKCDVHGWMNAWIGITDHPYFDITKEDGSFKLPNLPPGEYELEAWHEKYGTKTLTVKVGDKETKDVEFSFEGKKK